MVVFEENNSEEYICPRCKKFADIYMGEERWKCPCGHLKVAFWFVYKQ